MSYHTLLSKPLSLYSIPAVWFIALYPAAVNVILIGGVIGFDNVNPRGNLSRLEKKGHDGLLARAARISAAHQNGMENFPLWAAAVIAGNFAGVDDVTLNLAAMAYISLRILYNYIYFNQTTRKHSGARSAVFFAGSGISIWLLMKSASLVRTQGD